MELRPRFCIEHGRERETPMQSGYHHKKHSSCNGGKGNFEGQLKSPNLLPGPTSIRPKEIWSPSRHHL